MTVTGIIQPGYRVASGRAQDSPYPAGSIIMQMPFFRDRGLDLTACFAGTINVDIAPYEFRLNRPDYTFRQVKWYAESPAEDFSFVQVQIDDRAAWLYYPHPETKPAHQQKPSVLEILAPWIEGLSYGDRVTLKFEDGAIELR